MKHSFIILILATLFAAAPVLSAHAGVMLMDSEMTVEMMGDECDQCVDHEGCGEKSGMQDCSKACLSICATAGGNLAIAGQRELNVFRLVTAHFEMETSTRMSGALTDNDIPPPRI